MKILARYDDYYFGKEAYEQYHHLVRKNAPDTISKRIALADDPGGLRYEAAALGIGTFDLLECLEGMCYNREAREIDDSTYKILR